MLDCTVTRSVSVPDFRLTLLTRIAGGATSFFASTDFESLSRRYLSDLPVPLTCCSCSDPWMWIVLKDKYDVVRPLLLIKSDHWLGRDDDLDKIHHFTRDRLQVPATVVTMKNTWHYNFGGT